LSFSCVFDIVERGSSLGFYLCRHLGFSIQKDFKAVALTSDYTLESHEEVVEEGRKRRRRRETTKISRGVEPGYRSGSPGDGLCSLGCELAENLSSN
jgi:hypothetical protein